MEIRHTGKDHLSLQLSLYHFTSLHITSRYTGPGGGILMIMLLGGEDNGDTVIGRILGILL